MADPFVLRSIERLIAVLVGGLAIWLGFRLFLAIPDQRAEGEAELSFSKDRRLLVTRIGPGTFFALFGTAIVVSSYFFEVRTRDYSGFLAQGPPALSSFSAEAAGSVGAAGRMPLEDAIVLIGFLNEAEARLAEHTEAFEHNWDETQFRNARTAILLRAWQAEWGDPQGFAEWQREFEPRRADSGYEAALAVLRSEPP